MAHHGHVPGAPAGHRDEAAAGKIATVVLHLGGLGWASEKAVVERVLSHSPGVRAVEADPVSQTATVAFDTTQTSVAELRRWVEECGYHCAGQSVPTYLCDPKEEPPPRGREWADRRCGGGRRGARRDPCPRGLSAVPGVRNRRAPAAAREMPAEHRGHEMAAGGGAPSAQEMMGRGGAAGMSMDSMVRDMRNRFLVAATFSVPILLWSPIGRNVLGFTVAAPFGLRDDVWLLLLSLPVIFYSSWIFFDGAVAALLATGVSLAVAAAVASIAQWGPTPSPACCSRLPTR